MKFKKDFTRQDMQQLFACMEKTIEGDFSPVDESLFHDAELPKRYNQVLEAFFKSNNIFVMRLNNSMTKIGDSSCVKEMIEQLNSQTLAISDMRNSSQELGESIENIVSAMQTIQENSHEVMNSSAESISTITKSMEIVDESAVQIQNINEQMLAFQEKTVKINEIIDMVKKVAEKSGLLALNASIEAARAGEAGKGFAVVANQIKELSANTTESTKDVVKYVEEIQSGIETLVGSINSTTAQLKLGNEQVHESVDEMAQMNQRTNAINTELDNIFNEVNHQSALTQNFVASIDTIADSYDTLSEECVNTGAHLYKISRDIDKARSDMARRNSKLSTLDWLTVFEIDHLIFTWRLYNNIADFEQLKITQLNNPKGCKLGLWLSSQTDQRITGSSAFRQVIAEHETLHTYACNSWNAKDKGDREEALKQFNLAYETFLKLQTSIDKLREVVKSTGENEVTVIS